MTHPRAENPKTKRPDSFPLSGRFVFRRRHTLQGRRHEPGLTPRGPAPDASLPHPPLRQAFGAAPHGAQRTATPITTTREERGDT